MGPSAIAVPVRHRMLHRTITGACRRSLARLMQRVRRARWHADFAAVDERTLRDLGIGRDEIDSLWAESEGLAPLTRLHIRNAGGRGGCDADQ